MYTVHTYNSLILQNYAKCPHISFHTSPRITTQFVITTPHLTFQHTANYTLLTANWNYTKHYYAESERIASRIGGGGLQEIGRDKKEHMELFLSHQGRLGDLFETLASCLDAEVRPAENGLKHLYNWRDSVQPETDCYWYHPDHLGSSSWITHTDSHAVQHLHYLPWGEDFVNQRSTSWNAIYTFSAKEKDVETGLSYFGSRYYSSDLSIWLSVDPMASKYPSLSAYTYCANNPVKLVDPDGEEVWLNGDENSKAAAFKSMQEGTHLLLTMGKDGRITAEGDPISDADYLLLDAINDNSVKVNIECNRNGDAGEYHGTTYDKINSTATSTNLVNMFEMAELEKDAPVGSGIIHEVTEGYYAGLIAIATRKSIRAASRHREEITITGANINITGDFIPDYPMDYKKYRRAHYRATPAPNEMTPAQKNNFRSPSILYRIDQLQKKLQIL